MKRPGLWLTALALAVAACDIETSDNGHLDGLWQLTAVDTLATGSSTDMHLSGTYWAFQHHLLMVRDTIAAHPDVFFQFNHHADSLLLSSPYWSAREEGDLAVDDARDLHLMGIHQLQPRFAVRELSSGTMTLQSDLLRLHFRKY